jgi:hypothetical protein
MLRGDVAGFREDHCSTKRIMKTGAKKKIRKQWYGIRSIFLFGRKKNGMNVFEERVVVFSGDTVERAFSKAQKEAEHYAKVLNKKMHPYLAAYRQDGDPLIEGYEVWSVLYESRESLNAFVRNRYDKYAYHPE